MRRHPFLWPVFLLTLASLKTAGINPAAHGAELPKVSKVELQPLAAQAERVAQALELLGAPLTASDRQTLVQAGKDKQNGVAVIQQILDQRCLAGLSIRGTKGSPTLEAIPGPARPELAEQGWRVFLVKVFNEAGIDNLELRGTSPNAAPLTRRSTNSPDPRVESVAVVRKRFLELDSYTSQPLVRGLSGLELEYRILQVYCRDAGRKEANLGFALWTIPSPPGRPQQKQTSPTFPLLVESAPAVLVKLKVVDHDGKNQRDGKPVVGAFVFTDSMGRIYPSPSRRLAPDFNFHHQIYRADGETIALQPGKYTVAYTRGPEYLVLKKTITVPAASTHSEDFRAQALGPSGRKGLVVGRPSHPRGRLRPLRKPHGGSHARGHDAAHPG